jgi:hypothetical protein
MRLVMWHSFLLWFARLMVRWVVRGAKAEPEPTDMAAFRRYIDTLD